MAQEPSKIEQYKAEWKELFQEKTDKKTKNAVFDLLSKIEKVDEQIKGMETTVEMLKEQKAKFEEELAAYEVQ